MFLKQRLACPPLLTLNNLSMNQHLLYRKYIIEIVIVVLLQILSRSIDVKVLFNVDIFH
jgi:hypothetical protein